MRDFLVVYFGPGSRLRWVLLALAVLVLGWIAAQAQEMVLDRRVSASTDDAEESASGSVTKASSDLELVYDGTNQVVGMRFLDIAVPQGATITSAWIQFTADESQSEPPRPARRIRGDLRYWDLHVRDLVQIPDIRLGFVAASRLDGRPGRPGAANARPGPGNTGGGGSPRLGQRRPPGVDRGGD